MKNKSKYGEVVAVVDRSFPNGGEADILDSHDDYITTQCFTEVKQYHEGHHAMASRAGGETCIVDLDNAATTATTDWCV